MTVSWTEEVTTTVAKLIGGLKQATLGNGSGWAHVPTSASTSVATTPVAAGATSCTVASATGIAVGGVLTFWRNAAINAAANPECRVVTAVSGTTISWTDALTAPNGNYQVGDAIGVGAAMTATTAAGAVMAVDLLDGALIAARMQIGTYRAVSGGTLSDKLATSAQIQWKASLGATSDIVRYTVSASAEHLFIAVEGPRATEANPDSTSLGSTKQFYAISAITAYFPSPADVAPAFAVQRNTTAAAATSGNALVVSRDGTNTTSWVPAYPESVARVSDQAATATTFNPRGLDGSLILKPWIVMEDGAGFRGTLSRIFYGGRAGQLAASDPIAAVAPGVTDTYGGLTYKCIVPQRGTQGGRTSCGFGDWGNTSSTPFVGPLLFVPIA